jgi:hypothetical protein
MYCSLPVCLRRFFAILVKTTDLRVSLKKKISAASTTPVPLGERLSQEGESQNDWTYIT